MKPPIPTMFLTILVTLLTIDALHAAPSEGAWITLGQPAWQLLQQNHPDLESVSSRQIDTGVLINGKSSQESVYLVRVSELELDSLTQLVHEELHHCAGFFAYDSRQAALESLHTPSRLVNLTRPSYSIDHQSMIEPMLAQMTASNISNTILSLSSFQNRYFNGTHGAAAANWLAANWTALAGSRSDVRVDKVFRGSDAMPSVVLTIEGAELTDQVVVVGAHLDSVNVVDRGGASHQNSVAPGADDDASGVAGLTEILRQLMASGYKPQRTIKLMAYSGEEFGLFGSNFIAADFANRNVDVVGVLQLDMTNYKGSVSDIYLIDDYTDIQQNQFLENLATVYLPTLSVSRAFCGYACSDHASWNQQGYAASFPFEAILAQSNPAIHSTGDTYAGSGNQATNALKFTRLGLAYVVELGELAGPIFEDGFESASGAPQTQETGPGDD